MLFDCQIEATLFVFRQRLGIQEVADSLIRIEEIEPGMKNREFVQYVLCMGSFRSSDLKCPIVNIPQPRIPPPSLLIHTIRIGCPEERAIDVGKSWHYIERVLGGRPGLDYMRRVCGAGVIFVSTASLRMPQQGRVPSC